MKKYYFISKVGKVRCEGYKSRNEERFDLERFSIINRFESRDTAHTMRDILEERYPRIFYDERERRKQERSQERQ